jgi:hypothetical protein
MGLMLKKPEGSAGSALPAILVGLFVAFGGVLFGYVLCTSTFMPVPLTLPDMILAQLVVSWE